MARTVRDANLETRTARARLRSSAKPYYRTLDEGLHVGYRRGRTGGKWVVRSYRGDQTYRVETIGAADDTLDADGVAILNFNQAQALARERFVEHKRVAAGLPAKGGPYTVKMCVDEYLDWLQEDRKSAASARSRAKVLIFPLLGDTPCAKLTAQTIRDWVKNISMQPARIRPKGGTPQIRRIDEAAPEETRRRRQVSANRALTDLKAALNRAWRDEKIASDLPWRRAKPFKNVDVARLRYLSIAEAKRLINSADPHFRPLVKAALLTGCRYGELAALNVHDYDTDAGTLHIRTSKSGKGRHVVLTDEGRTFFKSLVMGRENSEPLLVKADSSRWRPSHQTNPMAAACKHAKITPPANFHSLRHTYASHSVMNGGALLVVAKNLGHVDTRMVELHYGHLTETYVTEAIRAAAPTFDIETLDTVVPLEARA